MNTKNLSLNKIASTVLAYLDAEAGWGKGVWCPLEKIDSKNAIKHKKVGPLDISLSAKNCRKKNLSTLPAIFSTRVYRWTYGLGQTKEEKEFGLLRLPGGWL
jgi:hypothetical protein